MNIIVAPSVLAADAGRLAEEIARVEEAGADWIHFDVMDGHFVPNLSFGPKVLADLKPRFSLPFNAHLMVSNPERFIDPFIDAGADSLTIHPEVNPLSVTEKLIEHIADRGVMPGLALNPETDWLPIKELFPKIGLILPMTVHPGFGGQKMMTEVLPKIKEISDYAREIGSPRYIQVDGGIKPENAHLVVNAGANVLVAGSAVFGADDPKAVIAALRLSR